MTLGPNPASTERLCSLTTGALGAFKGVTEMADVYLHCFDWLAEPDLPYAQRYEILKDHVKKLDHPRVKLVPSYVANSREELDALVAKFFDDGYEGAIIRNPRSRLKEGRPTKEGQLWRIKGWMDSEMLVTGFTEGQTNTNEAKTNTLGRTERSSAKDGMVPNGMVGSIQGKLIGDCFHPITGEQLFADGLPITIGTGTMTDAELLDYFKHPEKLVGHPVKFKHLAHGVKDLPRMGNYISHRLKEDM
jgi:DNA ligase-1